MIYDSGMRTFAQLQQKACVDFRLQVGQTTETVEVISTGVALKTDDAAVG